MSLLARYQSAYLAAQEEEMSLQDYLELCKADKMAYASVAERMLVAIGEPELVDTRLDPRLSRIFANKMLRIYPAFKEFYGMEEVIEHVVSYFRHAAQVTDQTDLISKCVHNTINLKVNNIKVNNSNVKSRDIS